MRANPKTILGSILADLGGVLLIVGVFVPYYDGEDLGEVSLWNAYSYLDILYIVLGLLAMTLASAAFLTGRRAAVTLGWAVGLFALGLTLFLPIASAFHWGGFGIGFYLTSIGAALMTIGPGISVQPSAL